MSTSLRRDHEIILDPVIFGVSASRNELMTGIAPYGYRAFFNCVSASILRSKKNLAGSRSIVSLTAVVLCSQQL